MEKLEKISKATLEIKERGILNFWIFVDYEEGMSQGVGGIALDTYDKTVEPPRRVGTAYGCEIIRQLLICLDVNDFSEMKDKMVWIIGEGDGLSFSPKGIRPLRVDSNKNNTVIFDVIAKEFIKELP